LVDRLLIEDIVYCPYLQLKSARISRIFNSM
jgi:hypothetical protein